MQRSAVAMLAQQGGGGGGFKVNYSPDWSLFTEGGDLAQLGLNLLAAIGLVCCTGFFMWGAILAAGGVSSDVPHNVARGKRQMFVSAMCALGIGVGAIVSDGDRLRPLLDDQTAMPPQPVEQQPVEEPTEPALSHTARTLLELQNDNLHVYLSDQTFEWDLVRHGNWEPCLKALELLKPRVAAQLRTAHAQSLPDIQAWALLDAIKKDKGVFAQALTQITADGDTLTAPPYLLDALHWIAVKT